MTLLIPAVAAQTINAELGPDPDYVWINIVWGLCAAILVSVGGRLSDIFGRRYFMLAGATISFLGTIVGATGKSIPQMIASGVLFGVGSGFQEMGFACIMEFIPYKYRLTALGKSSGPVVANMLAHNFRIVRHKRTAVPVQPSPYIRLYRPYQYWLAGCCEFIFTAMLKLIH
jgi:MFS family permease